MPAYSDGGEPRKPIVSVPFRSVTPPSAPQSSGSGTAVNDGEATIACAPWPTTRPRGTLRSVSGATTSPSCWPSPARMAANQSGGAGAPDAGVGQQHQPEQGAHRPAWTA